MHVYSAGTYSVRLLDSHAREKMFGGFFWVFFFNMLDSHREVKSTAHTFLIHYYTTETS